MTSILSQWKRVSNGTNSNTIIPKYKNIFWIFFAFPKSTKNLQYFEKEDVPQRLFVSEIIDCKKPGYLSH